MKKRLFALLLVISTLASMVVMPAYAAGNETENVTATTELCGCGCGQCQCIYVLLSGFSGSEGFYGRVPAVLRKDAG